MENANRESAQTVRGSYKQPGGKLVSASVAVDATGNIVQVEFDGDYFAERADGGDVSLATVAASLKGMSAGATIKDFEHALRRAVPPEVELIGIDTQGMAFAVTRAIAVLEGRLRLGSHAGESATPGLAASAPATPARDLARDSAYSEPAWAPLLADRFPENAAHPKYQIPLTPQLIKERWEALDLRIEDPEISAAHPYEPAMQMALDEVIARRTARGEMPPLLRFWEWAGPAVILGLNQSVRNEVDMERARELGIAVVRRVTGGGAMFVEPGNTVTYSLTVPLDFVARLSADDSYGLCESWTFAALRSLGIAASHEPINDISSPAGKIGGAAQRRYPLAHASARTSSPASLHPQELESAPTSPHSPEPTRAQAPAPESSLAPARPAGALLHHTTMAYDIDANKMLQVLRVNKEKLSDKAVTSAAKRVDPMKSQSGMSRRQILAAFARYLHETVPHSASTELPADVVEEARELAATKFATKDWIYRIP